MIVGTRNIDRASLREACSSSQNLILFAENLVPRWLKHIDAIVDNQKYLVAVVLRNLQGIPFALKNTLCKELLKGVVVRGNLSTIVDAEDILTNIDMDKLFKELFRDELQGEVK